MSAGCGVVEWDRLVQYWLGEPDDLLEEHLFECEPCTRRLERLAALATAIRRRAHEGELRGAVTPAVLERLQAEGVAVRRYRSAPGGTVHCTAGAQDDLVTIALEVPAAEGVARVDAVFVSDLPGFGRRVEDVPVADDGSVHWVEPGSFLRTLPANVLVIRLLAVEEQGERELARYTLDHYVST